MLAILISGSIHADDRFNLADSENTVFDRQTGLIWQRDGTEVTTHFAAALQYCLALDLDGRDNWRLPKIKELISLVDEDHYKPSAYSEFFTAANLYWSSTINPKRAGLYWTVNFSDGHVHAFSEKLDFSVRCVSDNQ